MRSFVFTCFLLFSIAVVSGGVTLKPSHSIQKEFLSLSDFFSGLSAEQDQEILEAPALGEKKHYPHAWVVQLAKNFGISWFPKHNKGIEFYRSKQEALKIDVLGVVEKYIVSQHPNKCVDPFEIKLEKGAQYLFSSNPDKAPKIVEFKWFGNNAFFATIVADGREEKFRGSFYRVVYVPTLKKMKYPGQKIDQSDINFTAVKESDVTSKTIMLEGDLVGKTLGRRIVKSNVPIKETEVVNPKVIKKGDLVTIKVETKNIIITARGKADKSAAVGDTLSVVNLQSKKMVEGVVQDSQTIMVPVFR